MYSTFFGECSSLKKRSYLSQWDFKFIKEILGVHCKTTNAACL